MAWDSLETDDKLQECFRLIVDNVSDVIWIAPLTLSQAEREIAEKSPVKAVDIILDRWCFSFVNQALQRTTGYTPEEMARIPIRQLLTPASLEMIRKKMIVAFSEKGRTAPGHRETIVELQFIAKDGRLLWGEVVSVYLYDESGFPTALLGITRDISSRRDAERALRESESQLRCLFENLPDFVLVVDRNARIQFANRPSPGATIKELIGANGFGFLTPEYQQVCRLCFEKAFSTGRPQILEAQDIYGYWWTCRVVPISVGSEFDRAMIICTDVTQERLATAAVNKEQRLLRQLLEIHEKERRLTAYEIHDGLAQQLTGAMYHLEGFRERLINNSEQAWNDFESAVRLISRAIDEARHLINGLRPPILDESGIVRAIEYLICEHERNGGPAIKFKHNVSFDRLAPPLETAIFRIVQESLQNACRHSKSDLVHVELTQADEHICIDVIDFGIGFSINAVEKKRFGLQGIRERARLLNGSATIESAPGKGTRVSVKLPIVQHSSEILENHPE